MFSHYESNNNPMLSEKQKYMLNILLESQRNIHTHRKNKQHTQKYSYPINIRKN